MRILNRKQFLAMPAGTLFAKYEPCVFDALEIKGDTLPSNDYCYQQIVGAIKCDSSNEWLDQLEDARNEGKSLEMDFECEGRDGCFDEHQLFAVFEGKDVAALIQRLTHCIPPITVPK